MTKKALVPFQAVALISSGLTGATSASRYVGATASGAPSTGTFVAGDWVVTLDGHIFICTTGGSPGTWANAGAAVSPATTVTSETTYGIAAAVGTSLLYARQDHTHGTPATPATSVAGRTGAVTLTAADVGAGTFPTANSWLFQQAGAGHVGYGDTTPVAGLTLGVVSTANSGLFAIDTALTLQYQFWNGAASALGQASIKATPIDATGSPLLVLSATRVSAPALTASGLVTANAGLTVPAGQTLTTGTRAVVTGVRATTTNASDTVDLGTFASTGGALELRIHAHLAAGSTGTTASVTKVYEVAAGATMGVLATVTAMTNVGTTVTATVASTTGLTTGQAVTIAGAAGLTNVNGTWTITVTSSTQFTFVVTSTPTGSYTASSATASAWYLCVPADTSQNAATTNDFALEVRRSAAGTFVFRFRQKSIGAAGVITFTVETLGDTLVTFTPSTTVTAAPVAVPTLHPSNSFAAAAGRVGIGTDSPAGLVHLLGIDPAAVVSVVQGVTGQSVSLEEWRISSGSVGCYVDQLGLFHQFGTAGASVGTRFVSASNNANLVFGSTADGVDYVTIGVAASTFTCAGDANTALFIKQHSGTQSASITLWQNAAGSATVAAVTNTGNVQGTGAYTTLSDASVKKNVRKLLHDPLTVIRSLRPVHYDYRGGEADQVGFIAQDTQKALPQAVVPWDSDTLLGQRSEAILAYVVAALQELDRRTAAMA